MASTIPTGNSAGASMMRLMVSDNNNSMAPIKALNGITRICNVPINFLAIG